MPTIDSLELEVQSSATSAVSGIDSLSASLSRLKTAVKGGVGLTSVTNQLKNINTALQSVDATAAGKLETLANSLEKLRNLGSLKISSSIATQISNIGAATRSLNGVDFSQLGRLATAIQPLASIGSLNLSSTISQLNKLPAAITALNGVDMTSTAGKIRELVNALTPLTTIGNSNLGSFFSQIRKLPEMAKTLNDIDIDSFADRIQRLTNALAPLASQLNTIASVFDRIPERILRIILRMDDLTERNNRAGNSYVNLWAKCRMAMNAMRGAARSIASWITQSNSYIENLNLFTASMGEFASEARNYAETVGDLMGIDPGEWMRNQGVFMTITKGFGVASDRAYIMSKNLTQLGYDLSSFFNIPFEDAMQKLQSGISGELEPLRRLGYDLSQARLKAVALSLGIKKSFNDMTQAEKAQLRYYTIMKQVTLAQGDMARTLEAPANQLRILQAQVTQCARALGNIFIPALNAILPYAIALAKAFRNMADAVALFFGFSLPEIDYSGLGGVTDSITDAEDALEGATDAAKKLKQAVIGIDELNIISPKDSSDDGNGLGDFGFDLPEYDFLGDIISQRADEIQKWMEKILPLVAEIGAGLAAWRIASSLIPDLGLLEGLLGGLMLAVGISLLIDSVKDIILNKELTWKNILEGAAGGALAGAGLGLMLAKQLGLSWKNGMLLGAVIGVGLALMIMSITAELVSGLNLGNILLGALGGAIAGAGLGAGIALKTGGNLVHGAAIGAVIGVGVTLLIMGIISELRDGVNIGNGILTALGGAITGAGIGFMIGGPAGAAIGAVVGLGVSLVITGLISQVQNGVDIGGAIMTILGSALAGAGIGFMIGGPAGAAVGAAIGIVVGIGLEFIGIAAAGKAAYEASEDFKVMENIISRSTETVNRCAEALKTMQNNISGLDGVSSDFAAASRLVSEIFDINENAHASNYELELMRVKVDVLNGMNIKGLSLTIDETTGRVKEARQEVEKLIESLQKEAQMEAMKELLVDTYKDLARAQADSVQALKDYDSAASRLAETSNELANCPWYDVVRRSELTSAQKEQTKAVEAAQQAYADSRDTIDALTGTIDLYSGQIVDMKLAEIGVGDELVSGLGNVQYSLDEVSASMTGYGANIAEGLRTGVDKNTKEKEYKSIWTRIGDWFKNLFGIHSPSKVFEGYGQDLSSGLLNGIKAYKAMEGAVKEWAGNIIEWFTKGVDDKNALDNIKEAAGKWANGFKESMSEKFQDAKGWVKSNITTPLKNAISGSPVGELAVELKNNASEWWGNAKKWWSDTSKNGVSLEAAVSLAKKGWQTVKGWIGTVPSLSQAITLAKSGWESVKGWVGDVPIIQQGVALVKSAWETVTKWVGNVPIINQGIQLAKNGWVTVRDWIGNIPTLSQAIALIKSGWTTVKNWVGNIPTLSQAISLIKSGWVTVRDWIGNIPIISQGISLMKSGWTTVMNWIGNIPVLSQGISLIKSGWSTVSNWVGNIPVLTQGISLIKSGWTTVSSWIGYLSAISQPISLAKSGWTTLSGWIGTGVSVGVSLFKSGWTSLSSWIGSKVEVGISLFKSGWTSIKSFFGLANGGIIGANGGVQAFSNGGYIGANGKSGWWDSIPKYANGKAGIHGTMFVAGEAGAEVVGHVNGQTEVLNRSQLAAIMQNSVVAGMGQFTGYWRSLNSQMAICTNAVIRSILVSADVLNYNMVNRVAYDPTNALAQAVYEDSQRAYDTAFSGDTMETSMRNFYKEYVEPTLKEIASDTKRQADKEEQTIVQVGNRTITDAVTTQQKANGYRFTT